MSLYLTVSFQVQRPFCPSFLKFLLILFVFVVFLSHCLLGPF